ncbi:hypothetical protein HaLaN_19571 [Haematococcus lacustris]|uniref:Uncharacterized protein n=1 Tax=Haematococcus lacustris TaxID=44745 RepID=A0A699ZHS2_HAELA|nr:hypothetical protein HaLaN_19571 [Haematococcus lacustris]
MISSAPPSSESFYRLCKLKLYKLTATPHLFRVCKRPRPRIPPAPGVGLERSLGTASASVVYKPGKGSTLQLSSS